MALPIRGVGRRAGLLARRLHRRLPSLPEAIVEACAECQRTAPAETRRDPSLAVLQVPGAVSQTYTQPSASIPPKRVAALLAPYRRHVV
ncbi:MAG: hypothetical protein U0797_26465 [Gemmataceae bacterium]